MVYQPQAEVSDTNPNSVETFVYHDPDLTLGSALMTHNTVPMVDAAIHVGDFSSSC